MNGNNNRGVLATMWIRANSTDDSADCKACGHFIEAEDFFESERKSLLNNFRLATIEDDIYALTHREELS